VLRAPGKGRRQRLFFYFLKKKPVPRAPGKGRRQRRIFIFLKKTLFAERPVQLRSAKLGTPELGKFFPELSSVFARSARQRTLCQRPLSAKRPHFFAFHINKHTHTHTHTHIYIYMTISHATIHNTYISHPQVHTHHMCPQVHRNKSTSPQIHKVSQIQRNKFTT
jgi:hypothetical protein